MMTLMFSCPGFSTLTCRFEFLHCICSQWTPLKYKVKVTCPLKSTTGLRNTLGSPTIKEAWLWSLEDQKSEFLGNQQNWICSLAQYKHFLKNSWNIFLSHNLLPWRREKSDRIFWTLSECCHDNSATPDKQNGSKTNNVAKGLLFQFSCFQSIMCVHLNHGFNIHKYFIKFSSVRVRHGLLFLSRSLRHQSAPRSWQQ